ncbi:MAG: hypothetical protein ACQESA_01010 [Patescibacteria group bacterium]
MKDIFPPDKKRSIRNITPPRSDNRGGKKKDSVSKNSTFSNKKVRDLKKKDPESGKGSTKSKKSKEYKGGNFGTDGIKPERRDQAKAKSKKWLWWMVGSLAGLGALFVVGFGISYQFATAEVSIKPTSHEADINETVEFYKEPSSAEGQLGFDVINIDKDEPERTSVEISGTKEVEESASGRITIYNEYSEAAQPLVENTRFESSNGLIFRIPRSITVPGMKDGKPGTISVKVYADEPGEEYNIGPAKFTIPGFEGSAKFDGFYAKSESPMEGGRIGEEPVVEDQDLETVKKELRQGNRDELLSLARNSVPEGFILFDGLYYIEEKEKVETDGAKASLVVEDALVGVLLKEEELAQGLYQRVFKDSKGDVEVKDWSSLSFTLIGDDLDNESESVVIDISGDVKFIREVKKEKLASELAGISIGNKDAIEEIMVNYPADQAEAEVKPFWMRSLPLNPENISINIKY